MSGEDKNAGQQYEDAMIGDPANRDKPKRQMTIASFCAMTCAEGGFHKFLDQEYGDVYEPIEVGDKELAAHIVKQHCGIESRRELNTKGPKQELWLRLQTQYQDWLRT